ncbi:RNA polymerase sigma factor [Youxingia wuxianensis]|uniref:RNA polymerase sigma factor n=1 Tax=Youxingia wuxianensis TaxID=2763678 RepID=A0A926EPV4_9FIRM|nr:RNA polymerase sigma factor [Youxingia wuxianensis]MBC8585561.1 RNA polymerase sigma factor [Youxingia wuxianensis]
MLFFMVAEQAAPPDRTRQLKIDETLLQKIGEADDPQAFEQLYLLTERAVYSYVLSIVKNPEDTLDIVQETYLKVRSAAHLYKPLGKPLAWIFTIAKNLSRNFLRQKNHSIVTDDFLAVEEDEFHYVTDRTDRMILEAALDILEEEDRQILLLHAVSGLRHREIAASLGVPLSTALSRYHRALKKLKIYLLGQGVSL